MNRAKQLEALRGMKFMQRKEEAIRREMVMSSDAADNAALAATIEGINTATETAVVVSSSSTSAAAQQQQQHASSSSSSAAAPVTMILMEDRFDPSSHTMGRKRFLFKGTNSNNNNAIAGSGPMDEASLWDATVPNTSAGGGNIISMKEGNGDAEDEGAVARADRQVKQQVNSSSSSGGDGSAMMSGRRFTIKESVRAPPMPRRLEEAMSGNNNDKPDTKRMRAEFGLGEHTNVERDGNNNDDDDEDYEPTAKSNYRRI